jgi:hypothetical protein
MRLKRRKTRRKMSSSRSKPPKSKTFVRKSPVSRPSPISSARRTIDFVCSILLHGINVVCVY